MSDKNNIKKNKKKRNKGRIIFKSIKILFIVIIMLGIIAGGSVIGVVVSILDDVPTIDPTTINALDQTSTIYDANGNLIEKIQAHEFRTIVKLDQMPDHLQKAFISIEDERFYEHVGIDPKGIVASAIDNLKAGYIVRGGSTITQQLVKNVYLGKEKEWDRKIKEAYLAIKMEKNYLTKNQILEAYLNRVNLGQNAYGVQEAAQTYFSKDVGDLTIAESALIAGIVKSPSRFSPYKTVRPENFDSGDYYEIAQLEILGEKYFAVYNQEAVDRQKLVLNKMLELGSITESEYELAINENIKFRLKPGQKKIEGISSHFVDYVKTQVEESLMEKFGYSLEEAQNEIFTGGLKIYSTIDIELQRQLEDIYQNFTEILLGDPEKINAPALINWRLDSAKNIKDDTNNILFYEQSNLFTENFDLIIEADSYEFKDNKLYIKNKKLTYYPKHIEISDYYSIDEKKNLVTYTVGSIILPEEVFSLSDDKEILIDMFYINDNRDFYKIDNNNNLLINERYFYRSQTGTVQPQSATVFIDYRTGQIKALVGGRDVIEGTRVFNRAISQRQPGSAMKPIGVYLPALDNGYTAASIIDDIPFYDDGELWPDNWYKGRYKGIHTLRKSVEQSANVNTVRLLDSLGIQTVLPYMENLGIISRTHPEKDSFVRASENRVTNDENLSSLALGGMTNGLTPLEITAAYGAIANGGVYIEPRTFTKIEDKRGNLLIDNAPKENIVVSPQVAYLMTDILRTTVSNGIASRASLNNMAVGGKTGTTQNQADIWFVGFTPYYATGVWIGNDSPKITLSQGSGTAANLWRHIMTKAHEGLEGKTSFNKPEGIINVSVCTQSGKLPTELCKLDPRGSTIRSEMFVKGTEPRESCDAHVEADIDITNGKLANEFCPEESVETKVFVETFPPYIPEDNKGIVPEDFQFRLPLEICDEHDETTVIPEEDEENIEDNGVDGEFDYFFPFFPEEPEDEENEDDNNNNNNNTNDENDENNGI